MFGELAALGASLCWALSAALFGRAGDDIDAVSLATLQALTVAIALSGLLAVTGRPTYWRVFPPSDLGYLAASGIAGLVLSEIVYFRTLNRLGPRLSLLIWSFSPAATLLVALVWLGKHPSAEALVGLVLTVAGLCVALVGRRRPPETRFRADLEHDPAAPEPEAHDGDVDWTAAAVALLGPLLMGVSFTALGGVRSTDSPLAAHAIRFAAAAPPLVLVVAVAGHHRDLLAALEGPRRLAMLMAAIALGTLVGSGLATYSVLATDPATAITLASLGPICILPITQWTESEPLRPEAVAGAVVAVVGASVVALG
ncbi:MAG: DMT family transporter [Bradymonadaceae bacterium]